MRKLLPLALVVAMLGCNADAYSRNDLELITSYTAKMLCSCMFVMERSEDYCREWSRQSPNVVTLSVDQDDKSVTSDALLMWSATARFAGDRYGCVLD